MVTPDEMVVLLGPLFSCYQTNLDVSEYANVARIVCKDFSAEEIGQAVVELLATSETTYLPPPGALRAVLDRFREAHAPSFAEDYDSLRRGQVEKVSGRFQKAVELSGGLKRYRALEERELPFYRKELRDIYEGVKEREQTGRALGWDSSGTTRAGLGQTVNPRLESIAGATERALSRISSKPTKKD